MTGSKWPVKRYTKTTHRVPVLVLLRSGGASIRSIRHEVLNWFLGELMEK